MIPKVVFDYCWVYDDHWKEVWYNEKLWKKTKMKKQYPSEKVIRQYIKKVEKLWRKDEKKILAELSKISGLKWKYKEITCFVVGRCRPFSHPLTIPIYKKHPNAFIDTLIHEMIHQLFIQPGNLKRSRKVWEYFNRKYKNQHFITIIHIPLHAMYFHIFLKFYNDKRLNKDIEWSVAFPSYKRSWDIVQKEGYQNIVKEFRKRLI